MEYYDNGSLHDRLRERGPLPVEDVVAAGTAVADALAFAHAQGFLHRDVKPQNILVLPTSYVLADFGIARMADAGHTTSLQMVSYRHAAPQMINGGDPSAADDQWSLGSTLFTLLDGAPPFSSDNPDEDTVLSYLERVRSTEPRPMRRSDVPPDLAAIIARCLSKRREDRFPDAGALRAALAAVRTQGPGWAPAMPIADFGPRPDATAARATACRTVPVDRDLTIAGPNSDLAGLTVRMPDRPVVPDFGPMPTPYHASAYPPEPPVVAVLPTATPWRRSHTEPDPTTTIARTQAAEEEGRRKLLLGVAAVLVGGAIGVLATDPPGPGQRRNGPTDDNAHDHHQTPTATTQERPHPPTTGGDPAFAPTLGPLDDQGDNVVLTWTDPTNGNAQFVVVDVTGGGRKALVNGGRRHADIHGREPRPGRGRVLLPGRRPRPRRPGHPERRLGDHLHGPLTPPEWPRVHGPEHPSIPRNPPPQTGTNLPRQRPRCPPRARRRRLRRERRPVGERREPRPPRRVASSRRSPAPVVPRRGAAGQQQRVQHVRPRPGRARPPQPRPPTRPQRARAARPRAAAPARSTRYHGFAAGAVPAARGRSARRRRQRRAGRGRGGRCRGRRWRAG